MGPQQHHSAVERSQKAHQKVCDAPCSVDGPGYGSGDREAQPRRDEEDQELRCFTSVSEVCTTSIRQVPQSNVKAGTVTAHAPAGSSRANSAHTQNKRQFTARACPKSGFIAGDCCPYELLASSLAPVRVMVVVAVRAVRSPTACCGVLLGVSRAWWARWTQLNLSAFGVPLSVPGQASLSHCVYANRLVIASIDMASNQFASPYTSLACS